MLTAAEVAQQLGLSESAVYALAKAGRLVCYRFGRAVRFDAADVAAFKAAQGPAQELIATRVLRTVARLHAQAGLSSPLSETQSQIVAARHRHMHTPPWADRRAMAAIYAEARRITAQTGIKHHVDHVIPLQGDFVCGLHVETNLQVLPAVDNIKKRNRHQP